MSKSTPSWAPIVDAFVAKINAEPREPERLEDVPQYLREEAPGDDDGRRSLPRPVAVVVGA